MKRNKDVIGDVSVRKVENGCYEDDRKERTEGEHARLFNLFFVWED